MLDNLQRLICYKTQPTNQPTWHLTEPSILVLESGNSKFPIFISLNQTIHRVLYTYVLEPDNLGVPKHVLVSDYSQGSQNLYPWARLLTGSPMFMSLNQTPHCVLYTYILEPYYFVNSQSKHIQNWLSDFADYVNLINLIHTVCCTLIVLNQTTISILQ